ncbi:cobalamin binding intrinsic factor-like isoform X1 [Asterias amurensis]|uniref:cobalamin binding intrinsic factor-like isoform X1 n=1 Tax=Asterias amurensis TaxID=7602 RepID=UPI003AB1F455
MKIIVTLCLPLLALSSFVRSEGEVDNSLETSCGEDSVNCPLTKATRWLLTQQEADWSWNEGTSSSSVVLAMQLANENWFLEKGLKTQLGVKQLEIELLAELARSARQSGCDNNSERHPRLVQIPVGRLALYILALESTCHDTTDFYGNDLVEILERNMKHFPRKDFNNYFQYSLGVLALCQSGTQAVKLKHIRQLLEGQEDDGCYMFDGQGADVSSLSLMALSCAEDSVPESYRSHFERHFNKTMDCILSKQNEDGSVGNHISTALASQALLAANVDPIVWKKEQAFQHIFNSQDEDGHFGNLGATVQILPILANRHHGSVKEVKAACLLNDAQPTAAQPASNQSAATTELGPPITIQITVENSVHEDQETVTVPVTGPAGLTLFQFLQRAMEISGDQFWFESKMTDFGNFMTSINGIPNDGVKHTYWTILIGPERESASTGSDGITPEDGNEYIFYYKAF